jgi:hypothetical protein
MVLCYQSVDLINRGGKIVEEEGFYSYINFSFDAFIYFDSFFKFISELSFLLKDL